MVVLLVIPKDSGCYPEHPTTVRVNKTPAQPRFENRVHGPEGLLLQRQVQAAAQRRLPRDRVGGGGSRPGASARSQASLIPS